MEYKGLILAAKCAPTDIQLRNYSPYRHIELALQPYLLERHHRARRDRTIRLVKKWMRMRGLEISVHAPYDGVNGSLAFYKRAYEFTRKIGGSKLIYHPSRKDTKKDLKSDNGISRAVEIMKRLANPPDVFRYMDEVNVPHLVLDIEHVVAAGLPLRPTTKELLPHVIHLHYSNTSMNGYHDNLVGGRIPLSDYRFVLKKVRERIPGAPNVVEVSERNYDHPVRTVENMQVLMSLIDTLPEDQAAARPRLQIS